MNAADEKDSFLNNQFRLASIWQAKGYTDRAVATYEKILAREPHHLATVTMLSELLQSSGDLVGLESMLRAALPSHPYQSKLHKRFIYAIFKQRGWAAAFAEYGLAQRSVRPIKIETNDILCCVFVRNERQRLPYFLQYYRRQGVTQFFVVDNASTDGVSPYLLQQPDVHLWYTANSFRDANNGMAWLELLLWRYGLNNWTVIADADELLYYPDCENLPLADFCRQLAAKNKRAMQATMLDMYSQKAVGDTHYQPGQDFLDVCPYFDRQYYHRLYDRPGVSGNPMYIGGMRQRIFGASGEYYLSKVPLLRYDADSILDTHWTYLPEEVIADERGCLLHFKYFSSFPVYVAQEVNRQEHYGQAIQYRIYAQGLASEEELILYDENYSVRFINSRQLVDMGIMCVAGRDSKHA